MSWMDQLGGMLQQYTGGSTSHETAEQDFDHVASAAPPNVLSGSLADAFRSNETPPFGNMLGQLFSQSNGSQKANILNTLIATAGPALLSGGLLGQLGNLMHSGQPVTAEAADQISPQDVEQMAHEAEKRDPNVVDRVSDFYSQHPTLVRGLGAAALAYMMRNMAGQKRGWI